ncbi:HpcH/HpaI aldolase/citrate lyase family protein [Rhodoferax sp.]|uniref:HpcH/HpaI aldolase/citrate lyase family protein n=1 Tax=Rhodoferax sp. TaxID=50421 RepID=UPI0027636B5E|nr:aldolase/citrate lyase family protein [Rhodoferax sp.]
MASVGRVTHPREVLLGAQAVAAFLPVCDHYSGVELLMRKSLALQAELSEEFGACVFDVTLDCEDGAPVGGEAEHAQMVAELALQARRASMMASGLPSPRIAVRVHPVDHPAFEQDIAILLGRAGSALCHVMIPKVETVADVVRAAWSIDQALGPGHGAAFIPLHALIESAAAVHRAFDIAAHPRIQSLSFGLMDFVSSHGGAIASSAMRFDPLSGHSTLDQFHHPLVVRAKLEIASACHAHGKVPSHCVVTELGDPGVIGAAAGQARNFGYARMWSIHPAQIRGIVAALAPAPHEIDTAARVVTAGAAQQWAPVAVDGRLHDRASYRYFWQVLERAHKTGCKLPGSVDEFFADSQHSLGVAL